MGAETFHGMTVEDCMALCGEIPAKVDEAIASFADAGQADAGQAAVAIANLTAWLAGRVPAEALQSWTCILDAVLEAPHHHKAAVVTAFQAQARIELSIPRLRNRALKAPRPPRDARGRRIHPEIESQEN